MEPDLNLGEALFNQLTADIIDGSDPIPVWHIQKPVDGVTRFVRYQIIDQVPRYVLDGNSGLNRARVQIEGWDISPDAVESLHGAVMASLDRFTGALGGGPTVQSCQAAVIRGPLLDPDTGLYRVMTDFLIDYEVPN